MPYALKGKCVVKADTGEAVPGGCHDTEAEALKHLQALEANVKASGDAPAEGQPVAEQKAGKQAKVRTTYLAESALLESAADGAVAVTLIKPGWSSNNRYYSRETLARAADKFDGAKAYIDHPSADEERNRPERSVKDIAGYYSDVKQADDGRLVGKLHLVGVNGAYVKPLVDEALAGKSDLIGLSINALGKTSQGEAEGRKGILVEDIVKGNSTDIVTTPAAGGRFERLAASGGDLTAELLAAMDFEEWREASKPEFVLRLREEVKSARQDDALKAAQAQIRTLGETINERDGRIKALEEVARASDKTLSDLRAEIARRDGDRYADKLLTESRLPNQWQSAFRPQMVAESNTANWPLMVNAELAKYRSLGPATVPVRGAGSGPSVAATYNPVAEALGVSITPKPTDTPKTFAERKARLTRS